MKLSTLTAKLTCIKPKVLQTLAAAAFAGAVLSAAAPAAHAQQFAFGVQLGGPRYVAPAVPYGYYAPRYDSWREHEAWVRQQQWRREQEWRREEAIRHADRFRSFGEPYGRDGRNFGYRP